MGATLGFPGVTVGPADVGLAEGLPGFTVGPALGFSGVTVGPALVGIADGFPSNTVGLPLGLPGVTVGEETAVSIAVASRPSIPSSAVNAPRKSSLSCVSSKRLLSLGWLLSTENSIDDDDACSRLRLPPVTTDTLLITAEHASFDTDEKAPWKACTITASSI